MEVLYRDVGACVGAHARESNSTSDTVIQVLQRFCCKGVTQMMTPCDDLTIRSVMGASRFTTHLERRGWPPVSGSHRF